MTAVGGELKRRFPLPRSVQVRVAPTTDTTACTYDGDVLAVSSRYADSILTARAQGIQDVSQQLGVDKALSLLSGKPSRLTAEQEAEKRALEGACGQCPSVRTSARGSRRKPEVIVTCSRGRDVFIATALGRDSQCS